MPMRNGVSAPAFFADNRLTTEIDVDYLVLNGLLTELQASIRSYKILVAIADGLSERCRLGNYICLEHLRV